MKQIVYLFNCSAAKNLFGFTLDENGTNLPRAKCSGNWEKFRIIKISATSSRLLVELQPKEILQSIADHGYYLTTLSTNFLEKSIQRNFNGPTD
jgi:hypothetical protein